MLSFQRHFVFLIYSILGIEKIIDQCLDEPQKEIPSISLWPCLNQREGMGLLEFLFLFDGGNIGVLGTLCTHFCQKVSLHKPTTFGNWNSNYVVYTGTSLSVSHSQMCVF